MKIRSFAGLVALYLVVAWPAHAQQSDSALEAATRALASQLRCPVCQGLSIQDSPSELAQEMKNVIRDQLRSGKSPQQVRQYFVDKYGEWILLEPEPRGANLLVYLAPLLAVGGGAFVVWRYVRRWSVPPNGSGTGPA
jgi:cytochrome c-type biogenesis protein CcmH